ncbi:conserved Plasmodium protein, unknown function [Plasmodium berghei]|uniref:Uncharacterized protein n=2 Tax=Plasmodium berghei TaxID=5821 RepID=A0A509AWI3_PLABA|nr:conserved Plasmodium protein, unknown function [Plasmodium berghei ANKA]CXI93245.1 conserved Plasmodium protein, unknown function [Plasmodium berghei]SCL96785.1 conserved Plasmodium protein, unknown function [Plasmodium berghei]SCM16490.1 conserved Plasmodium protein, unknown function [Plasmodium berghei]SCM18284.1 conserved Plasmodium protein, unknown function [Plasmodium berghei]SCN27713.1 conserved Plasmodium protein, unknown function [Plasmodium berghei]|eukprot:XP_034423367.1 conserved Plasmodium protein, unknown function [Plasmodium berghei ANKA]
MKNKQKGKAKKLINLSVLEDKINILDYMKNDFEQILKKENDIFSTTSAKHAIIEEKTYEQKENIDLILEELIISCEEKIRVLNNYIDVVNDINQKNNDILEKEKKEMDELVLEKNKQIFFIEQKIELTKKFSMEINYAIIDVFNHLNLFLKNKMNLDLNIEAFNKTKIMQIDEGSPNITIDVVRENENNFDIPEKHNKQNETTNDYAQKLYNSIDEYNKQISKIRLFLNENEYIKKSKLLSYESQTHTNTLKAITENINVNKSNYGDMDKNENVLDDTMVIYNIIPNDDGNLIISQNTCSNDEDKISDEHRTKNININYNSTMDDDDTKSENISEDTEEEMDLEGLNSESFEETSKVEENDELGDGSKTEGEGEQMNNCSEYITDSENISEKYKTNSESEHSSFYKHTKEGSASRDEVKKINNCEYINYKENSYKKNSIISIINNEEIITKTFTSEPYKKIISDGMNNIIKDLNKIDYNYISYFKNKLKND